MKIPILWNISGCGKLRKPLFMPASHIFPKAILKQVSVVFSIPGVASLETPLSPFIFQKYFELKFFDRQIYVIDRFHSTKSDPWNESFDRFVVFSPLLDQEMLRLDVTVTQTPVTLLAIQIWSQVARLFRSTSSETWRFELQLFADWLVRWLEILEWDTLRERFWNRFSLLFITWHKMQELTTEKITCCSINDQKAINSSTDSLP